MQSNVQFKYRWVISLYKLSQFYIWFRSNKILSKEWFVFKLGAEEFRECVQTVCEIERNLGAGHNTHGFTGRKVYAKRQLLAHSRVGRSCQLALSNRDYQLLQDQYHELSVRWPALHYKHSIVRLRQESNSFDETQRKSSKKFKWIFSLLL